MRDGLTYQPDLRESPPPGVRSLPRLAPPAAKDPQLLATKPDTDAIGPRVPDEIIRHARTDRVLASFIDNAWTKVGRCAACHSPDRNQKQVEKHGEQVSWIKRRDPQATLRQMLDGGLIDPDNPEAVCCCEIWLKLTDVPERFDQMLLQVDLYRWDGEDWSKERWATSDRPVFGKGRLWQHSLSLTAPRGSRRAEEIRAVGCSSTTCRSPERGASASSASIAGNTGEQVLRLGWSRWSQTFNYSEESQR